MQGRDEIAGTLLVSLAVKRVTSSVNLRFTFLRSTCAGLFALSVIFTSCMQESTAPVQSKPVPGGVIVPLNVGNQWVYACSDFDSNGALVRTFSDTVRVVRDTMVGAERWFIDQDGVIQTNRGDGRYLLDLLGQTYLVDAYPVTLNQSYGIYGGSAGVTVRVVALDRTVSIGGRDYACIVYEWSLNSTGSKIGTFYLCRNIGMVKRETFQRLAAGALFVNGIHELVSVTIQ